MDGAKLIVANPYEIPMVKYAHLFLQHRPGTDLALLMGMARVIVDERLQDQAFIEERCENFEAFKDVLGSLTIWTSWNRSPAFRRN